MMDKPAYEVRLLPEAEGERDVLDKKERTAVYNAIDKLRQFGPTLGAPHSSQVKGATKIRELRPRQGRSTTRPLYRQVGPNTFVIASIAPEVETDRRGYKRAVEHAEERLKSLSTEEG